MDPLQKIKSAYEQFVSTVKTAMKKHRDKINGLVKQIDERKIEKLKHEIKSK